MYSHRHEVKAKHRHIQQKCIYRANGGPTDAMVHICGGSIGEIFDMYKQGMERAFVADLLQRSATVSKNKHGVLDRS